MSDLVSTGEAARSLGVTVNTVKAWIRAGRLRAIRLPSGHFRIPRAEVERIRGNDGGRLAEAFRQRRRGLERAEEWLGRQPVEPRSIDDTLRWIDVMLRIGRAEGPPADPAPEETAARIERMRRRLARVRV